MDTLALVDTGAVASLISFGLFQKINQAEIEEVTPYYRQFKSAGGHPLHVQGCYRIPFEIEVIHMRLAGFRDAATLRLVTKEKRVLCPFTWKIRTVSIFKSFKKKSTSYTLQIFTGYT